ncbi:MAG: ferrous iron transport protein A [Proteobacteria bacterium]|nr:MAG: ferrous iron transport protein A [Pseudomonadota bacterium]
MNLSDTKTGLTCKIVRLHAKDKILQKLLDMGFTKNSIITILREAPLYDPMELNIKGYNIALRKSEAALIEVEPL